MYLRLHCPSGVPGDNVSPQPSHWLLGSCETALPAWLLWGPGDCILLCAGAGSMTALAPSGPLGCLTGLRLPLGLAGTHLLSLCSGWILLHDLALPGT